MARQTRAVPKAAASASANPAAWPPYASSSPPSVREAVALPWPLQPGDSGNMVGDLPDINVWLALAVREHPHHAAAQRYWTNLQIDHVHTLGAYMWFCRTTMLGLVRLMCQPKAVGPGALGLRAAWELYQQYRARPQVGMVTDGGRCDTTLQALLASQELPPRLWTDTYLAAQAQASGLRLVSFDRDFERFSLQRCLILPSK
jgi:uncharacterized protein